MNQKISRAKIAEYPVLIRQKGRAVLASCEEFGILITENAEENETEALFQIARLVQTVRARIAERLTACERLGKSAPTPLPPPAALVSLQDAARILRKPAHEVRALADLGALPSSRTRGGHRRFKKEDLENFKKTP